MMMKKCLAAYLAMLGAVLMMAGSCGATERLTDQELKSLLESPDIVVIDLRTSGEWEGSPFKVPHAVHEDPTDVLSWAAKYSIDSTVVLYCS